MSRVYENPPIIEAICEFRFEPSQPWDWTVPGLVYAEIKADFPEKKEEHALPIQVRPGSQEVAYSLTQALTKMQFLRKDQSAMVQVGPDMLAFNQLRPYPKWPTVKSTISSTLEAYLKIAEPISLQRIGLRCINRIRIPEEQVRIEDFIQAVPTVPNQLPQHFITWAQRVELPVEEANGILILKTGSMPEDSGEVAFLLDLDFVTLDPQKVAIRDAMDWVDAAHDKIEEAFEACITDKARELFNEVIP